jgi:hypothetical protein
MKKIILLIVILCSFIANDVRSQFCIYYNQFTVTRNGCVVTISFNTPCQAGSLSKIYIERSHDAVNWISIKEYSGSEINPGSSLNQSYSYVDPNPYSPRTTTTNTPQNAYYRVKFIGSDQQEPITITEIKLINLLSGCSYPTTTLCGGTLTIPSTVSITQCEATPYRYWPSGTTDQTTNWSSSNTSVASIDNNGIVTAHTTGSVVITAYQPLCNKTATSNLRITTCINPCTSSVNYNSGTVPSGNSEFGFITAGSGTSALVTNSSSFTNKLNCCKFSHPCT